LTVGYTLLWYDYFLTIGDEVSLAQAAHLEGSDILSVPSYRSNISGNRLGQR